ncbi:MAG: hypothetical protein IKF56_05355 [Eggerthellaceae bacterium]|nr:hypothetical protein [Eggerthellaceae bacterium]
MTNEGAADADQELLEKTLERVESMESLAERVLAECRVTLMMSFRFLDRALWKIPFCSMRLINDPSKTIVGPKTALATDGHVLYYNAKAVIGTFRINPDLVVRAYLHALLHCIFRHPFRTVRASVEFWSLACDVCIEAIALEMCNGRFTLDGDDLVKELSERASGLCGGLTPSKLYRVMLLSNREECSLEQMRLVASLEHYRDAFAHDNHHLWELMNPPKDEDQDQSPSGGGDGSGSADDSQEPPDNPEDSESGDVPDSDGQESDADPDEDAEPPESSDDGNGGNEEGDNGQNGSEEQRELPGDTPPPSQQQPQAAEPEYSEGEQLEPVEAADDGDEDDWAQIAKQVETELRTLEKERGEGAGTFMDNLALANRSRVNYDDFLRRFATRAEDAKLNDEEFDYIFYTYGLKLYENMPLVEPLEYKESERIREFVIAIDTSGSCSRGLVQLFLTRTYEILSRSSGFDERVNVHIIQCDADVQSVEVVHDVAEFADYQRTFEVKGYGGTDFRPVFAYVDDLVAKREFKDLRGVVYFTDGYGTFPVKAPDYDVAFVFVEEDGKSRRVPPWAMKVILDEDTLYEMDSGGKTI